MLSGPEIHMSSFKNKLQPLVSIIISSYNYGRFLKECIDSALNQTYLQIEVIVVDDGSTDNSCEIIAGYENKILKIFQQNCGQASAFNNGFKASRGDIICFLDSDDILLPTAIQKAVELFGHSDIIKAHWPLWIIDEYGTKTGRIMHSTDLSEGDLRDVLLKEGPAGYNWPSTTGNAWVREFINKVFPIPENMFRIGPDAYLSTLAPLFGSIGKVVDAQGCYRIHGTNNTYQKPFEERLRLSLKRWDYCFDILDDYCRKSGIESNRKCWEGNSWWHKLGHAIRDLRVFIPKEHSFILVDNDEWAGSNRICGREVRSFLERNGIYWGAPPNDEIAIQEFERMYKTGIDFLVVAWPAFWWFDYYKEWHEYICNSFHCILDNNRLVIFNLQSKVTKTMKGR